MNVKYLWLRDGKVQEQKVITTQEELNVEIGQLNGAKTLSSMLSIAYDAKYDDKGRIIKVEFGPNVVTFEY